MSTVTRFYGRVNDQEFENVNDYNKAIVRAINDGDLKNATSRTWVEEVAEDPKPQNESELYKIFKDFSSKPQGDEASMLESFNEFKDKIHNHFDNVDDSFIESDLKLLNKEIVDLQNALAPIKKSREQRKNTLSTLQYNLNSAQRAVEEYTARIAELQSTINTDEQTIETWNDLCDYLLDVSEDVKTWIDENLHQEEKTCEKCGTKCDDCKCENKQFTKPVWMDTNHFNFLKEIFG